MRAGFVKTKHRDRVLSWELRVASLSAVGGFGTRSRSSSRMTTKKAKARARSEATENAKAQRARRYATGLEASRLQILHEDDNKKSKSNGYASTVPFRNDKTRLSGGNFTDF
jgi:hypothetical protein